MTTDDDFLGIGDAPEQNVNAPASSNAAQPTPTASAATAQFAGNEAEASAYQPSEEEAHQKRITGHALIADMNNLPYLAKRIDVDVATKASKLVVTNKFPKGEDECLTRPIPLYFRREIRLWDKVFGCTGTFSGQGQGSCWIKREEWDDPTFTSPTKTLITEVIDFVKAYALALFKKRNNGPIVSAITAYNSIKTMILGLKPNATEEEIEQQACLNWLSKLSTPYSIDNKIVSVNFTFSTWNPGNLDPDNRMSDEEYKRISNATYTLNPNWNEAQKGFYLKNQKWIAQPFPAFDGKDRQIFYGCEPGKEFWESCPFKNWTQVVVGFKPSFYEQALGSGIKFNYVRFKYAGEPIVRTTTAKPMLDAPEYVPPAGLEIFQYVPKDQMSYIRAMMAGTSDHLPIAGPSGPTVEEAGSEPDAKRQRTE